MQKAYTEHKLACIQVRVTNPDGSQKDVIIHPLRKIESFKDLKNSVRFMSKKGVLHEKNLKARNIYELFFSNSFILNVHNIPEDVENILRRIEFTEHGCLTYYDFLLKNVDKIIWCAGLYDHTGTMEVSGFTPNFYKDKNIFQGQRIIFLNSNYNRIQSGDLDRWDGRPELAYGIATTLIHETAHKEAQRLAKERKIHYFYAECEEPAEHYAFVRELEFVRKLLQQPLGQNARDILYFVLNTHILPISQKYNERLGLTAENSELLTPIIFK